MGQRSAAPLSPIALSVAEGRKRSGYDVAKRCLDVAAASGMLVALAPMAAAIALAIKLVSPGPAIFRQERIGKGKRPFTMYKFRTMRVNSDPSVHQAYVRQWANGK